MRTARFSDSGGFPKETPDRPPPPGTWDQGQRPPQGTWDQAARQEVTSYRDPPTREQNDRQV